MNAFSRAFLGLIGALLFLGAACSDERTQGSAPVATQSEQARVTTRTGEQTAAAIARAAAPAQQAGSGASAQPSADEAIEHVRKLSVEIGPRVAGSAEEHAAAEYIGQTLRAYGYEVEFQPFPVQNFISKSVSFQVESPTQRAITVQPITLSAGGEASGRLVYAGRGKPEEFPAAVRGQIALVERGEIFFRVKAANALAAGAKAVVIFNNEDQLTIGTLQEELPGIPVLAISGVDGRRLRDEARAGDVRATVSFDGGLIRAESLNVIGRPKSGICEAVVGGHYDSVLLAPGASDNATGTAAMLETARLSALRGNPQQACFVAFAAEEIGLVGSRHFARSLTPEQRRAITLMINFDMVGVGAEWRAIGQAGIAEAAVGIAQAVGVEMRVAGGIAGATTDHASFEEVGIRAIWLHRINDPLLHTPEDVIGRVDPEKLAEAVRVGLAWLAGLQPA